MNVHSSFLEKLEQLSSMNSELIVLHRCPDSDLSYRCHKNGTRYKYPEVLGVSAHHLCKDSSFNNLFSNLCLFQKSMFCLIFRGSRLSQPILLEAMAYGCIPIVFSDTLVMPFHELIDWNRYVIACNNAVASCKWKSSLNCLPIYFRAAFMILESNLNSVVELAKSVSISRREELSLQCLWLYSKYFSSMEAVTNTTLLILNQRVFPENALFYENWNIRPTFVSFQTKYYTFEL